jgi:hypothetical protein
MQAYRRNGSTASAKANLGSVTIQQARKIVAENSAANKSVSTTLQAQDETGFALESDNSTFRYDIQGGHGPAWQKTHYVPFYEHVQTAQSLIGSSGTTGSVDIRASIIYRRFSSNKPLRHKRHRQAGFSIPFGEQF